MNLAPDSRIDLAIETLAGLGLPARLRQQLWRWRLALPGHGAKTLCEEIRAARAAGVTWKELSRRIGLSRTQLWRIAAGRSPDHETAGHETSSPECNIAAIAAEQSAPR